MSYCGQLAGKLTPLAVLVECLMGHARYSWSGCQSAAPGSSRLQQRVKLRRTQCEQISFGLLPKADLARVRRIRHRHAKDDKGNERPCIEVGTIPAAATAPTNLVIESAEWPPLRRN